MVMQCPITNIMSTTAKAFLCSTPNLGARHQANGCEASGRASLACPDEGIRYVFFSVLKTGAEEGLQVGTEGAQSFQPLRCGFNDFLLGLKNLAPA